MKRNFTEQRFELNRTTTVIIKSKMKHDVYTHKISVVHDVVSMEPMTPKTHEEVVELVKGFDLEDEQTELNLSEVSD